MSTSDDSLDLPETDPLADDDVTEPVVVDPASAEGPVPAVDDVETVDPDPLAIHDDAVLDRDLTDDAPAESGATVEPGAMAESDAVREDDAPTDEFQTDEDLTDEDQTADHLTEERLPTGEEILAEVTADDLDAPDVQPGAADPGAADSPTGRRDTLVVGGILLLLVIVLGAVLLTRGGSGGPAYTAYGQEVSVDELQTRLTGLVEEDLIEVAGNVEDATPEQLNELATAISTLITSDVMTQAAEEQGFSVEESQIDEQVEEVIATAFGGDPEAFQAQMEEVGITEDGVRAQFRVALLAEQLVQDSADPIDDAAIQEAYDANFATPTVSHILTETEDEAVAALERIEDGEDFGAVASEVSIDPGSGAQGGELGPLVAGQFVPEFEEAALGLEPGELSDPVETQFGFHIITVGDPVPLEDVRDQIAQQLEDQQLNAGFVQLAQELDEEAMVTVDPSFGTWGGLAQGLVPPATDVPLGEQGLPPEGAEQAPAPTEGG